MPFLVITLGAMLGANLRYLIGLYAAQQFGTAFPYGTLFINVTGSFVIGLFLTLAAERLALGPLWRLFFATGFLGAYTTFSSYTYEAAMLLRAGAILPAVLYLIGSVAGGMLGVLAGIAIAERF